MVATRRVSSPYTIRQRSDGRYEVRLYTGTDSNGKKTYKSIYGRTSKELKEKLKEIATEQKKNRTPAANINFRDYALHWMRLYKYPVLKPVSYDRLEQTYNKVCEYLGWIQMGNISTDDIQEMINDLARTKAYSTVKKHHEFVKNVFSHAYKTGELDFNPCEAVALPIERNMTVKTKPAEILLEEETEAMYAFNEKIKKSRNQFFKQMPALLLMLNTGWRVGELLALEWTDIDFKKRTARINKTLAKAKTRNDAGESISRHKTTFPEPTKTKAGERLTPLNDMVVSLLKQIKEYNQRMGIQSNYVVCTKDGGYVSERNLLRTFKSVMGIIGAEKDYTIHSLRHTYASRLLKRGVDVSVVSKLLGHSDINTTYGKYIHVLHTQLMQSAQSVERI